MTKIKGNDLTADTPLDHMAKILWSDIHSLPDQKSFVVNELISLIELMLFDRIRVRDSLILTEREIQQQLFGTFHHSINLMLTFAGSSIRADQVPSLMEAFGWCSVFRDLEEDLDKGLVNIPQATYQHIANEVGKKSIRHQDVVDSKAGHEWLVSQYGRANEHLAEFDANFESINNLQGSGLLKMFAKSIRRFARRFSRQHALGGA